jgi:diacylglycerol kinase (ATP)
MIINTKSGPKNDSILHVRHLVGLLAAHSIRVDVRVKLRKKQATAEARAAAKAGYPLVVAAGGDGTVEAVARGLVGTKTVLGIIPLGTYNNEATCLGIPTDPVQACALIATGATRPVDVGLVKARGRKKARPFLEMAAVGVTAALMPAGQSAKKGAWNDAVKQLPQAVQIAVQMAPVPACIRLDKTKPVRRASTLLVEVANAPRMGPGLAVSPDAVMDDGLLDVAIYDEVGQTALAARFLALKAGTTVADDRIERARARRVDVWTATPLPVIADSKVLGTTPVRIEVLPGALLAVAGQGEALSRPVSRALVAAAGGGGGGARPTILPQRVPSVVEEEQPSDAAAAPTAMEHAHSRAGLLALARTLALPAAAAAGAAALSLLKPLIRRRPQAARIAGVRTTASGSWRGRKK